MEEDEIPSKKKPGATQKKGKARSTSSNCMNRSDWINDQIYVCRRYKNSKERSDDVLQKRKERRSHPTRWNNARQTRQTEKVKNGKTKMTVSAQAGEEKSHTNTVDNVEKVATMDHFHSEILDRLQTRTTQVDC